MGGEKRAGSLISPNAGSERKTGESKKSGIWDGCLLLPNIWRCSRVGRTTLNAGSERKTGESKKSGVWDGCLLPNI